MGFINKTVSDLKANATLAALIVAGSALTVTAGVIINKDAVVLGAGQAYNANKGPADGSSISSERIVCLKERRSNRTLSELNPGQSVWIDTIGGKQKVICSRHAKAAKQPSGAITTESGESTTR